MQESISPTGRVSSHQLYKVEKADNIGTESKVVESEKEAPALASSPTFVIDEQQENASVGLDPLEHGKEIDDVLKLWTEREEQREISQQLELSAKSRAESFADPRNFMASALSDLDEAFKALLASGDRDWESVLDTSDWIKWSSGEESGSRKALNNDLEVFTLLLGRPAKEINRSEFNQALVKLRGFAETEGELETLLNVLIGLRAVLTANELPEEGPHIAVIRAVDEVIKAHKAMMGEVDRTVRSVLFDLTRSKLTMRNVLARLAASRVTRPKILQPYAPTSKTAKVARAAQLGKLRDLKSAILALPEDDEQRRNFPEDKLKADIIELEKQILALGGTLTESRWQAFESAAEGGEVGAELFGEALGLLEDIPDTELGKFAMIGGIDALQVAAEGAAVSRIALVRREVVKLGEEIAKLETKLSAAKEAKNDTEAKRIQEEVEGKKNERMNLIATTSMEIGIATMETGHKTVEGVSEFGHFAGAVGEHLGMASDVLVGAAYIVSGALSVKELVQAGLKKKELAEEVEKIQAAMQADPDNDMLRILLTLKVANLFEQRDQQVVRQITNSVRGTAAVLGTAKGLLIILVAAKVAGIIAAGTVAAVSMGLGIPAIVLGTGAAIGAGAYAIYKNKEAIANVGKKIIATTRGWQANRRAVNLVKAATPFYDERRVLMKNLRTEQRWTEQRIKEHNLEKEKAKTEYGPESVEYRNAEKKAKEEEKEDRSAIAEIQRKIANINAELDKLVEDEVDTTENLAMLVYNLDQEWKSIEKDYMEDLQGLIVERNKMQAEYSRKFEEAFHQGLDTSEIVRKKDLALASIDRDMEAVHDNLEYRRGLYAKKLDELKGRKFTVLHQEVRARQDGTLATAEIVRAFGKEASQIGLRHMLSDEKRLIGYAKAFKGIRKSSKEEAGKSARLGRDPLTGEEKVQEVMESIERWIGAQPTQAKKTIEILKELGMEVQKGDTMVRSIMDWLANIEK